MFIYIYICIPCTWCCGVFVIVYGTLVHMFGLVNDNPQSIFLHWYWYIWYCALYSALYLRFIRYTENIFIEIWNLNDKHYVSWYAYLLFVIYYMIKAKAKIVYPCNNVGTYIHLWIVLVTVWEKGPDLFENTYCCPNGKRQPIWDYCLIRFATNGEWKQSDCNQHEWVNLCKKNKMEYQQQNSWSIERLS